MRCRTFKAFLLVGLAAICLPSSAKAQTIYQTNFDGLAIGRMQPFPGRSGQDGWHSVLAEGEAYGEIKSLNFISRFLHQFAPKTNPSGLQTVHRRNIATFSLSNAVTLTMSFTFWAQTSGSLVP